MFANVVPSTLGIAIAAVVLAATPRPAQAIPIFAQRYGLQCGACHSVLPELNAFGNFFGNHGYRLTAPKHGTTVVAIRYQMEYDKDANANAPRFVPGGVLLSNADIGKITAFLHYNLGAQGGPSGTYLAYLARYDEATRMQYRLGLFELPLIHSPGQRLDDLAPYGFEQAHVGLNDLSAATQAGRHVRLLLEKRIQAGRSTLEGALTVGFPWPAKE